MKSLIFLFAFLSIFLRFSNAANVILENSKIKLVTDGKHLISLYDKLRQIEHISGDYSTAAGFLGVSYANATTSVTVSTINSSTISLVTLVSSSATQATFLLEDANLKATIGISLTASDAEIIWNITVELKNALYVVSQVDFPRYRTPKMFGGKYKNFVECGYEGHKYSLQTDKVPFSRSYPGKQALQMSACISSVAGIMLWTDDTQGQVKAFGYLGSGESSHIAVRHLMPYSSAVWQASYNTRMVLIGNEWQDAAEIYRQWATKQYWSATPLRDRKDVPVILHEVPIVFTSQLTAENLSTLPSTLMEWSKLFGARAIYEPTHYEKYGKYAGIDYFPVSIGNQQYLILNNAMAKNGSITAGCIEGFHWTRSLDDGTAAQNQALANFFTEKDGANLCRKKVDGSFYTEKVATRNEVYLCRGTNFGRTFLQGVASQLFDLGVTAIHNDFDQMMAFDGPCFNKNHGHPVPYGTWQIDLMKNVYNDIITEAKNRKVEDFYLTKEMPSELYNMILHGNQVRNYEILNDATIIPLYLYVYHDYITSLYGFGWLPGSETDPEMCAMLVYGQIPAIGFWQSFIKSPTKAGLISPNALAVMKDYYGSMKLRAKDYLLYGRLLKPAISAAPATTIHNTWQEANGNIGVFAVNTTETSSTTTVKVPGTSKKYLNVFNGTTLVSSSEVMGGSNFEWNLPKWRLSYLIFSDAQLSTNAPLHRKQVINVYPNPVTDLLTINLSENTKTWDIEVFDITGKLLIREKNKNELAMKHLDKGIYMIRINSGMESFVQKFIKT